MTSRTARLSEADRRARRMLRQGLDDCRAARHAIGASQAQVAEALGCSRQLVTAIEAGRLEDVGVIQFARYAAVVGLDASLRTFSGEPILRDIGQVRLLKRFKESIGGRWTWRLEAPVTSEPSDRRAFDALLVNAVGRVAVEAITRLSDNQAQLRPIAAKQEAAAVATVVLVVGDSRHNRETLVAFGPYLHAAFPTPAREVLRDLRAGRVPRANGIVMV